MENHSFTDDSGRVIRYIMPKMKTNCKVREDQFIDIAKQGLSSLVGKSLGGKRDTQPPAQSGMSMRSVTLWKPCCGQVSRAWWSCARSCRCGRRQRCCSPR
jgi:hypothetical protein